MDAIRRVILHNERGVALVYLALTLVVLMGMGALAVDMGYMYVAKSQLQNAADAAALAGAAKLNGNVAVTGTTYGNYSARLYAKNFALKNSSAGEPVKLALNEASNDSTGDIFLCYWTGSDCIVPPSGQEPNAVQVVARKTGEGDNSVKANNSKVSLFFAKVINSNFSSMGISAKAIAIKQMAMMTPIAVNEYWFQNASNPNRPYGSDHDYPNSFVRKINVDGTTPSIGHANFGRIYALLGSNANNNNNPSDPGGFVALDFRSSKYDGAGTSWYQIDSASSLGTSCASCGSYFSYLSSTIPQLNSNAVSQIALGYLTSGYPSQNILPAAYKEKWLGSAAYPDSITYTDSNCPYATVGYFSGGGASPANSTNYRVGDKLITAVYDGIVHNPSGLPPKNVNIIGYSAVQIDGYSNKNPKDLLTDPNFFNGNNATLYGHTLDFVEPSTATSGTCNSSFTQDIMKMRYRNGTAKLVK